jgi:hypothetical protein
MHLLQARLRDVGVDLGRRQALVTEELLDDAKVRSPFYEVRGVRVAQRVRVHVAVLDPVFEDASDVARAEATGPAIQKQGFAWRVLTQNVVASVVDPEFDRFETLTVQRHHSFFTALSQHAHEPARKVDAHQIKTAELRNA